MTITVGNGLLEHTAVLERSPIPISKEVGGGEVR